MFQNRFSSFPCGVQDFLREREAPNIGTHIKDVNSKCTFDNITVLMMVCMYSHAYNPLRYSYYIPCAVEKVKWLLSKGVDPNIQDDDGYTALMLAARYSKPVKIFKGKCFMKKFEKYNIHPIEQRINHKLSLMIVNYFNKDKNIRYDSSEKIVKILLEAGADPNKQNKYGWTALMMAACHSSPERGISSERTVEMLLTSGADPNKQTEGGWTALILAARDSSPERGESSERTVEILLGAGADPNKQKEDGGTALMIAALYSSPERGTSSENAVKILLEYKADPNKRNDNGFTALNRASTPSVKQLIQKYL